MTNSVIEGNQFFSFSEKYTVIKFDDSGFYKDFNTALYGGKGIDILAFSERCIQLIEIKDFQIDYSANKWRLFPKDGKRDKRGIGENDHSLDIEVAQKVVMSVACMYGVWSKNGLLADSIFDDILCAWDKLTSEAFCKDDLKVIVILHIDGIKECHTRTKKTIMRDIQRALKNNLRWMKCQVLVQDKHIANTQDYYKVTERESVEHS